MSSVELNGVNASITP